MLIALGAILGAVFGSFLATVAIRWPGEASALRGRSACDGCGAPIGPRRLVPVLSFFIQRGRAACCGAPIDRVHPAGEIAGAAIGAASVAVAADPVTGLAGALFGGLLLLLALLDARAFWLPDRLTGALAIAGLASGLAGLDPPLADRAIGAAAGFLLFAAVRFAYRRLRGREGMGGGDVKLFGAIGLWLGWRLLPLTLFAAAATGLLLALVLRLSGRPMGAATRLPFGIFLAIAAWLVWLGVEAGALAALAGG